MLSSLAWNEQLPPGRVWRNYHIQGPPNRLRRSGGTRRRVHQGSHGRQPRCERFQKEEISTSVRRCWVPTPQVLDFFPKTQGVLDFVTLIRPWFNRQWAPAAETPFHWFSHSGRLWVEWAGTSVEPRHPSLWLPSGGFPCMWPKEQLHVF